MASSVGFILGSELAVLQAPILNGLPFDPFMFLDDGLRPVEAGIGRLYVLQALLAALMFLTFSGRFDLAF